MYDCVWFWVGGEQKGAWRQALPGADIRETVRNIERSGYVAVTGKRSIGAPEGPPSPDRIRAVLRANVERLYHEVTQA